ncbi:MAG: autotransporter outer membrane beta-barrel domain-containing protein [Gammaproteobacteria bacterium AqS3]|nr:autotransporter outer membrane beta-barrel domain-containing protein [Gammaproteobacteria bacterium AqS3]
MAGSAWGQTRQLVVSTEHLFINEGSNADFTVALGSQPTGTVTVTIAQPSNTDVTVDTDTSDSGNQNTLTFSTSDWNTAKSVRVTTATDTNSYDDFARIRLSPKGGGYSRTENGNDLTLAYTSFRVTVVDDDRNAVFLSVASLSLGESATSLAINEGTSKDFRVRLTSQPSSNVTVTFSESSALLTLDKTSLTFTNSNWNTFQTVVVSVPEDNVDRASSTERISVTATGSYAGSSISVLAVDNDNPIPRGMTASVNSISLSEGGNARTFTVALTTAPAADAEVSLYLCRQITAAGSPQDCEARRDWVTVSPSRLTFTPSSYGAQTVTVTPVEDSDAGDESAFIYMFGKGGGYSGVTSSIKLTSTDNDTRALVTSPDSGLTVAQGAGSRLGIRLATQPTGEVNVGITKAGTHSADVTLNKGNMTFTQSNWNQTQYLTVFVDSTVNASQFSATIELSASGADYHPYCSNKTPTCDNGSSIVSISESIAVTLVENAFRLSSSSLSLDEGEDDTFTVRLATKPHEDVTVTLAQPSNPGVRVDTNTSVTGYQNTLTFTPDNWDTTQTVTVYALEDDDADDIALEDDDADDITLRPISITASGGGYGRATGSMRVSVDDDETYSLDVSETSLSLTEGGSAGTFTVALTAKPNRAASFRLVTSDTGGAITATPSTLTFNLSNYDTPQTVTVSPGHDPDAQDDSETISINPVIFDNAIEPGSYDDVTASVSVNVTDDDSPGFTLPSRLSLDEGGGAKTFAVSLAALPAADVTVSLTSGDTGAVTVSPASLTFVLQDYYTRVESSLKKGEYVNVITPVVHTVTVTPVDDSDSVDESVQIFFTASDGGYDDVTGSVTVSVNDDELRKLELPTTSVLLRKAGHPNTFRVGLQARPSGNVTVSLVSSDTSVVTVSPASMTFTPLNYGRFQTATVATTKAANSGDETASINLSATGGGYNQATGSVSVSVGDLGFALSSVNLSLTEGGSAGNFTVALATLPTANVTVSLASGNSRAATVSPASLTFTPSNYDTAQTVTVTPVQDDNPGDRSLRISLTSSGGGYGSVTGSVAVAVEDDDDRGLDLSSTSLSINEGATGTFTVKLNTQPPLPPSPTTVPIIGGGSTRPGALSSDVTVSLVSSDTSNVTVSPSSLTFTRNNYNTTQTVTVTAIEDSDSYSENANINLVALGIGSYFTGTVAVSVVDVSTGFDFSSTSLMLTERGTATFTVTLNEQQPQSDVEVLLLSSDMSSIRVSPSEMKFTPSNYRQPQTVTVTAIDDGDSDDEDVNISFLASGGNYDDATGRVAVSVTDDDIPVLDISRTRLRVTEETAGTFSVKLRVTPSQNVTVSLTSADTSSVTVSPSSLTFSTSNYDTTQAVTVTAVDDADLDSENVNIALSTVSASGSNYNDVTGEVAVSVVDNDAAIFELSATKLTVAERNTDSFTVKLRQPPSGSVTVSLVSSDTSSVTASPSSLTFTTSNYDTEQTVTVAAIEDWNSSGENVNIDISASGGGYDDVTGRVSVITEDNDVQDGRFTIHNPTTKQVSLIENTWGTDVTWTLGGDPDPNTVISLRSSDEGAVRVTPSSMVYGSDEETDHRKFTVTPVIDEDIMDERVTIYMSVSGGRHSGATETVAVTVDDDDQLGLKLSKSSLSLTEGGSSATFTVAMNQSIQFGDATVSLTSGDTDIATVSPASLTFDNSNFDAPQTVTITPVDDSDRLDDSVEITLSSNVDTSNINNTNLAGFNGRPVKLPVTVIDDDRFDVVLSETSLSINEGGSPNTFTVVLDSQPSADVTVSLTSSDAGAATVPSASLTFTASNYDRPQTVTVTPVDDGDFANENVNISFSVSGGGLSQTDLDRMFGNLSVSVSVDDDDTGSLDFSATSLQLSEGGAAGTFEVKLAATPTGRVTVAVEGNHGDAVTISPSTLNFTASNYDTNRTVTVTPMDDADLRDENVDITLSASGGGYDDVSGSVAVSVGDDDAGALELSANSLELIEGSGVDGIFTVRLAIQPLGNVTVDLASEDDDAATVSPSQLTFTRSNYDMAQTVTVTPVHDGDLDDESLEITLLASGGGYDDVDDSVAVSVDDNSALGLELSVNSLALIESSGVDGTFTVRLPRLPTGNVTVDLASDDTGAATVSPELLTFTQANYSMVQTVTVSPVNDADLRDENLDITLSASGGGYDDVGGSVAVSVDDDNSLGLKLSANSLWLDEGGDDGTFTVKLTRQPTGNVTVDLASDDTGAATVSPSQLIFTQANYETVRTVTVAPVDDTDINDEAVDITLSVSGGGYDDAGGTVQVSVDDNSGLGLELSVNSLWLEEDGADGTFTVRLMMSPTGNVTVDLASDDTGAATVSPAQLIFTQANYDTVQTVTVTPEVDADINDEDVDITLSASGGGYNNVGGSVAVSVDDDNSLGLKVSANSLSLDEGGGYGTFTVRLTRQPTGNVTVDLASDDTGAATVDSSQLTFTTSNYNNPQKVKVTPVDDADSNNEDVDITLSVSGGGYDSAGGTVQVSVADDDRIPSYLRHSPSTAAKHLNLSETVTEQGKEVADSGTLGVRLSRRPSGTVTLTVTQVSPANKILEFDADLNTSGNQNTVSIRSYSWRAPKAIKVFTLPDINFSEDSAVVRVTATGGGYDGQTLDYSVTIEDTGGPLGIVTNPASSLTIKEGENGTIRFKLSAQPPAGATTVVMEISTSDESIRIRGAPGSGDTLQRRIDPADWDSYQNVVIETVRDFDDLDMDDETAQVTFRVASGGGAGVSWQSKTVTVNITDADIPNSLSLSSAALTIREGEAKTFAVRLTSAPGAGNTIIVAVAPDSGGDLSVDKPQLTFDNDNWSDTQTVTVTAGEDLDSVNDDSSVTLTASGTSDYSGKMATVNVRVIDEDEPVLLLSATSVSINEGGSAGTFTVELSSPPTDTVTVGVLSRDIGIARVSPASLTFDSSSWNTAQTVSVTAAEDDDFDNEKVTISLTASGDDDYDGLAASVSVSVADDDSYFLDFSDDALSLNEGGTGSFTVALGARPLGDVTVTLMQPSNTKVTLDTDRDADGNQTTLNFLQSSWNVAQNVYVKAALDSDSDDETATISMSATGGGYGLYGVEDSVVVSVTDNGALALTIGSYERALSEGQTYMVDIRLASQPESDVTVAAMSSDPSAVAITDPASGELTFTTSNWSTDQTLSFQAVEDGDAANERVVISMSVAGTDYSFSRSLVVTTQDNDKVELVLSKTELTTVEGVAGTFTVKLGSQPTGTVTVTPSFEAFFGGTVDATLDTDTTRAGNQSTLKFTKVNWNTARTVAVMPNADDDAKDEQFYVNLSASGANYDHQYGEVTVTVTDDDGRGILVSDTSLLLNEGGTASFSLRLSQQPSAGQRQSSTINVRVGPGGGYFGLTSTSDTAGSNQDDVILQFTDDNWDTAQTVEVSAPQDDNLYEERTTLYITAEGGDHTDIKPAKVRLHVLETNYKETQTGVKEIDRGAASDFIVVAAGTAANTFDVSLSTAPTQNVRVTLSSVLTLDKTTLNFIPGNYNTVQTVTITPFTDTRRPATENFDVTLQSATTPAVTGADQYRATRVFSVEVTRDNSNATSTELALDRPHLVVTAGSQSNVIMVALSAQPGSDVQVIPNMSSEDFKIATATPRILTFNSSNWETPQAVTVTSSTSTTETTVDVILNGQSRIPVSQGAVDQYKMSRTVTVTLEAAPRDLRAIGFNLSKPSLQVTEGGTPGTFDIKLTRTYSSSLRAVQIDLTSDDTAIATVSPANLIFTSTNWSTAQTVTVASVEDADMDDERVEIKLDGYSLTYPAPKDDGSTPPPPEKSSNRFISYTYTVSVVDDDDSGFVLSPRTLALVEGGSAGSFTVALATQPTEDVTVSVASLAPNAATVSESSLTFTRANYNTPQSVTVTPVDDVDLENETFNIVVSAADGGYGGDTDTVAVTVEDDDSVGFTLSTKALTVAEEGTGFFTVALRNEPTGEVMVTLSQPDNDDVRLDTDPRTDSNQNTLTFGENDWNEGKRVTVSAGHDVDSSNEGPLTVNLTASGGGYGSAEDSMTISVTDNDPPELDVGVPASGLAIEEGMTGTFTIALATQPAGDVTVTLMQPNNTDIKVDTNTVADGNQRTLSFGTDDWSTPQTVTVRVRDDEDSENETGSISMSATGGGYESAGATVLVRVTDTDTPGLTLTASQLSISEGENQTFDVSLRVDPNGPVTVTLEQPSNNDVTLDTSSDAGNQNMLEFTADTWDIPQTVTVNTVADADAVDDSATINISALNSGYGDVTGTVTVTVTDPQVQGLVWSESPLSILEGENKTVTLKLLTQPTEDVTVTLGQPSNTDLTLDTNATDDGDQSMLTFTTDNWNTAQDVVFRAAVDQDQDTGSATVNVTTSGGDYDDLDDTTLSIRIIDKDVPRLLLSQSTLSLSEGGAAGDFTVELSLLPTEAVTVSISAGADADLLQISTPGLELTFRTDNWNVPQMVTISAAEDTDATDEDITVSLTAAGGNYAGVTENVAVTIDDDEAELVLSAETLSVIEGGASGEFTVALSSRPTATVTLNLTLADNDSDDSTDPSQALEVDTDADTAGPQTTLTFTQDDWGTARTVMVTAIEDGDITEEEITITLSATGGDYAGLSEDVTVSVSENDIPRIVLTETSLALCEVADGDCGISGSFTAVFSVAPDQATAVTVTSSDPGAAAVTAGATLTFSPNDWSTPQTVTITRVEDNDAVNESVTVTVAVTTTGGNYAGQSETVAVSVRDSGTAGLTLSPTSLTVTEGSTGTFDVQLAAEPTENVTVTLAQPSNADVTVDTDTGTASNQNTLTFDASNWNRPQTVTVSAAEDVDGNNDEADIVISASGGEYADADEVTLRVTVNDNDTASLELSGDALGIDEGSTGTFNVKLGTQPVGGNVTVGITSDDAGAVSVSTASLTFTADNWNATQNITVTGVGDDDAENEEVTVTLSASGADYGNVADVDVTVTVTDDEDIEMTLSTSSLTLTEGEVGTFTVELGSQPTDDVTVSITSSDTEVAFAEPDSASLTFTADNWEDAQTVMINAADDSDAEDGQATITVSASGGGYGGVESGTVAVEVWDDDRTAGLILSTTGPLSLEEDSASDSNSVSFTVKLASPPVGDDVTVAVTNPDAGAVSASAPSLTFTTSNWNITQPLTIGAVQDDDAQNEDVTVTLSPTGGGYGSEQASTLQVTVDDDESIGLMISAYLVELEEGNSVDLTVSMASQPTADVTVTFANPEPTFLAVDADSFTSGAQGSMTFRTDNWETPQTVSIIAIEDDDLEDGKATVTYRVAGGDYEGYCQAQGRDPACAIEVTVTDNDKATAERDGATQVLAAVARATLAGSLDVISRRFDASAGARRVQFGGRNVALDQSGIDDLVGHFAQMARTREEFSQSNRYGDDLFGVNRQSAEWLGSIPLREGRPAFAQPNAGGFSNDMQMLGSFTYALTSSADSGGSSMATSSLWGSSEQREFSGTVQQVPYEGNQSAVWLGYDQRTENGWLYGVAASRSSGEADYKIRNSSARIETQLRTYMPYIEITGESGASVRVVYGFGIGEVKVQEINSNEGTAKLTMDMTSVGGRWPFLQIGIGGTLSATGSIASSRMTTGSSAATPSISELNVDSQQMRAGLELAHSGFGSGMRLAPRFGVAVRQDEGDGITGSGVEVTAAVQMTTPGSRFSLDLNGHWLTSHSAEDETEDQAGGSQTLREEDKVELDEWGMSLTLRVASSDAVGRGFSMSLGPEWGAQQSDLLDREEAFNLDQHDLQRMQQSAQRMVLATRLGYGMDAFGGLLTPFAEYNFSGGSYASSRLTSGLKFMRTDSFEARLFGEQRITQGQKPENKIGVELRQYLF